MFSQCILTFEEAVELQSMQNRQGHFSGMMRLRRQAMKHPFVKIKSRMVPTHFLTKMVDRVSTK